MLPLPAETSRSQGGGPRNALKARDRDNTSGSGARFGAPLLICQAQHLGASRLVSAGRGSTSGSGRYPSAFRAPPPLDAARRSTPPLLDAGSLAARFCWQGQHFRLWMVPERVWGPPLMLPGAALGSLAAQVLDSLLLAHTLTRTLSQLKLGARRPFLPPLPALAFERCCKPSGLLVSASA